MLPTDQEVSEATKAAKPHGIAFITTRMVGVGWAGDLIQWQAVDTLTDWSVAGTETKQP